jgi:hypothetical protein
LAAERGLEPCGVEKGKNMSWDAGDEFREAEEKREAEAALRSKDLLCRELAKEFCRQYCAGFNDFSERGKRIFPSKIEIYVKHNHHRWMEKAADFLMRHNEKS